MAERYKMHQPSLTIDEQIKNLRDNGLIILDEDYARHILNDISYFKGKEVGCNHKGALGRK